MKAPKQIVISHVYSRDNKGDAVLTSVLIADLKRKYPDAHISILALQPGRGKFEGCKEYPSFMSFVLTNSLHPLTKLTRMLYMIPVTLLWAAGLAYAGRQFWLPNQLQITAQLYAQADLVVPVGGGHIRSQKGTMGLFNVLLLLHPLWFGVILKKPTILYSQSIGPFRNRFENQLAALTLKRMTLILLREDTSMELLKNIGVRNNIMRSIDSGFLHVSNKKVNLRKLYNIASDELIIGVTVRAWLDKIGQAAYEKAVAKTLDTILDTVHARVIFIPQVTAGKGDDDRTISRRVFKLMKRQDTAIVIENEPDHHEIKALYDNLDILLGTRFHSVIFSLTSHVPVMAIEYEHKTSGIMHDLELDQWVMKIEAVSEVELTEKMMKLINEKHIYKQLLRKRLPAYIKQARQTVDLLDQAYQQAP